MITRRRFVAWAGSSALAFGIARAQQPPRIPRIGFLNGSNDGPEARANFAELERGLRELGYREGKAPVWAKRFADGRYEDLPRFMAELIRWKPDLIVVAGGTATDVARKATSEVPLVMVVSADPIANGFVSNLAHPGGNLTGVTSTAGEGGLKRIELLLDLAPKARRVAVLFNSANPTFSDAALRRNAEALKRERNVQMIPYEARSPAEIAAAFPQMRRDGIEGLSVPPDSFLAQQHGQIAELAIAHSLPSMGGLLSYADSGGLGAYGANYPQLYFQAAAYIDKIARGARPGDLAIARADVLEFWVNRRTAEKLGVVISETVLVRAHRIIQ